MRFKLKSTFLKLSVVLYLTLGIFAAASGEELPSQFTCFKPTQMTPLEFGNRMAYAVGKAVLYPGKSSKWFENVEKCFFEWYVSKDFSLAGFTWDTNYGLLKLMSTDPEQFFSIIVRDHPAGYEVWLTALDHSQFWGMDEKCPDPSPLQQAARSINGFSFRNTENERLRVEVLNKLHTLECHVPQ